MPKCYERTCDYNGIRMFNASILTSSSEKVYMVPSYLNNATYPDEYGVKVTDGDGTVRFIPGCDNKNPPGPNTYTSGYASAYTTAATSSYTSAGNSISDVS